MSRGYKVAQSRGASSIEEEEEAPAQLSEKEIDKFKDEHPTFMASLEISPLIEFAGYLKDHRLPMKMHWVSSKKELGADQLKGSLQALFESELVMGSLGG